MRSSRFGRLRRQECFPRITQIGMQISLIYGLDSVDSLDGLDGLDSLDGLDKKAIGIVVLDCLEKFS